MALERSMLLQRLLHRSFLVAALLFCLHPSPALADRKKPKAPKPSISSISPSSASIGASVQILGTAFGANSGKVKFGKNAAIVDSWSDTSVSVTVPSGKKKVTVTLTTALGKKATKSFTFSSTPISGGISSAKVLAVNDLGMHCVDKDFSVFSILPPYNVVQSQVVTQSASGNPRLVGSAEVDLRYTAITDPGNSKNSFTQGKTNFWEHVQALFGVAVPPGQGFFGLTMPADASSAAQTSLSWKTEAGLFKAEGIPIYPIDDANNINHYPLMRVNAYKKGTNIAVGSTDIVLPVSEETTCMTCHATGKRAANLVDVTWADNVDKDKEARLNVLLLHDFRSGTSLSSHQPVLCASCHYSPALDLAGAGPNAEQQQHATMSRIMHSFHADKMLDDNGNPFSDALVPKGGTPPAATQEACYTCHPGAQTKCLRGAMSNALSCQNCHGGMKAVGGDYPLLAGGSLNGANDGGTRRPWKDLPRCQSCHTGDAAQHLAADASRVANDLIRFITAFNASDASASPTLAPNSRFAENPNTLFRFSKGHGGLNCEMCHGSTHAIWPNQDPNHNDNIAATELQGHSGTLGECRTCHLEKNMTVSLNGPHGMHPVNDSRWIGSHGDFAEHNTAACKACHGTDYRGTVLSAAFADRTIRTGDFGTIHYTKGQKTGCYDCHNGPRGE